MSAQVDTNSACGKWRHYFNKYYYIMDSPASPRVIKKLDTHINQITGSDGLVVDGGTYFDGIGRARTQDMRLSHGPGPSQHGTGRAWI